MPLNYIYDICDKCIYVIAFKANRPINPSLDIYSIHFVQNLILKIKCVYNITYHLFNLMTILSILLFPTYVVKKRYVLCQKKKNVV